MHGTTTIHKRYDHAKIITEPGQRWVQATISTISVDRDGDVVLPSGMSLKDYSGIVLFVHDNRQLPVAKAPDIRQRANDIQARVLFMDRPASLPEQQEWVPDTLFAMFQQGFLKAFSIKFLVYPGGARMATAKDRARFGEDAQRIVTQWSLVELSIVPIGANPEALATAVSKGFCRPDSYVRDEMLRFEDPLDWEAPDDILSMEQDDPPPILTLD